MSTAAGNSERLNACIAIRNVRIAKVGETCARQDSKGVACGAPATVYHVMVTPTLPTRGRHGKSGPPTQATRKYLCLACCDALAGTFEVGSVRHV